MQGSEPDGCSLQRNLAARLKKRGLAALFGNYEADSYKYLEKVYDMPSG